MNMKKSLSILLVFFMLLCGILFSVWKYSSKSDAPEYSACIANPFEQCADMTHAEELAGFSMNLPDLPEGFSLLELSAIKKKMIQAIYENQGIDIYLRKSPGNIDISGDYNYYKNQDHLIINDKNVTLKGNDDKIMVATWCQGAYTYAIDTPGVSADVILKLIQQMD